MGTPAQQAAEILQRAISCDQAGRLMEARQLYEKGIGELMAATANETNIEKKTTVFNRIKDYLERAEQLKTKLRNQIARGIKIDNIVIEEDSVGNSYRTIIGKYFTPDLMELQLDEPYLIKKYHFQDLIQLLEMAVKQCHKLKYVQLTTKPDDKSRIEQLSCLNEIKEDLARRQITFVLEFDKSLHDRTLILGNGYVIKMGLGLHFYKATYPLLSLGLLDYDFRKCKQTDIDIWFSDNANR